MATRTVRLDDEAEAVLDDVRRTTGLPISEALKQGLRALQAQARDQGVKSPYDIYQQIDLGPGGYAVAPSTDVRRGVREAVRRKLRR